MGLLFYLKLYALTAVIFFIIDIVWLGVVAKAYYRNQLSGILGDTVNWRAAILFYLIYIVGIIFFAVRPCIETQSIAKAAVLGALYGFFTYATYDLTNLATINGWPVQIAIVDIVWGTLLCSAVSTVSCLTAARLL